MSDHGLKVGDVCKDPAQLRAGMTVRLHECEKICIPAGTEMLLASSRGDVNWVSVFGYSFDAYHVRAHGVTILALPEEAPKQAENVAIGFAPVGPRVIITKPAAPSLEEQAPVGSKWKIHAVTRPGELITVEADGCRWVVDGTISEVVTREYLLKPGKATRIDEPAGAGKLCNAQWGFRYTCDLRAGHDGKHRDQLLERRAEKKQKPAPAMPPARCAPGCTPSKSCRIVIPVTDKGTRYECPAFAEERVKPGAMVLDYVDSQARDRYEARAMRDQRWEAATPMVGRYRFNRR